MFDSNTLYVIVDPSKAVSGARTAARAIDNMARSSDQLDDSMKKSLDNTSKRFNIAGTAIKGLTAPIRSFVSLLGAVAPVRMFEEFSKKILQVDRTYNGFIAMMNVTTGDVRKSADEFQYLTSVANKYGVSVEALTKSYAKLAASTVDIVDGNTTKKTFEAITAVSSVMHAEQHTVERMFNAIIQIASKGQVHMEELKQQLGEHLPGTLAIAADAMGMSMKEMIDQMSKGEISAKRFLESFPDEIMSRFAQAAEVSAQSMHAQAMRLRNAFFDMFKELSTSGVSAGFSEVFKSLANFMSINNAAFVKFSEIIYEVSMRVSDFIDGLSPDDIDNFVQAIINFGRRVLEVSDWLVNKFAPAFASGITIAWDFARAIFGSHDALDALNNIDHEPLREDLRGLMLMIIKIKQGALDIIEDIRGAAEASKAIVTGKWGEIDGILKSWYGKRIDIQLRFDAERLALGVDRASTKFGELDQVAAGIQARIDVLTNVLAGAAAHDRNRIAERIAELTAELTELQDKVAEFEPTQITKPIVDSLSDWDKVKDIFAALQAGTIDYGQALAAVSELQHSGAISSEYLATAMTRLTNIELRKSVSDLADFGNTAGDAADPVDNLGNSGENTANKLKTLIDKVAKFVDEVNAQAVGVDKLTQADKLHLEVMRSGLSPAMKERLALSIQQAEATRKLTEETRKIQEADARRIKTIEESIAKTREEIETYGLSEQQLVRRTIRMKEVELAIASLSGTQGGYIQQLEEEIRLLRIHAEELGNLDAIKRADQARKDAIDSWQNSMDEINRSLTDALMRAFESGEGFGEAFKSTLVNMFKTMVLQPILAPIVQGFTGMIMGGGPGGGGQGGGGIGGQGGGGFGFNPMSFLSGTSMAQSAGYGLMQLGAMTGWSGAADMGFNLASSGIANWQLGLAGIGGGLLGNLLFDGKGYSGLGGSLGGAAGYAIGGSSAAMVGSLGWAAGPIGAIAGAVLGSALGSLFGGSGERFPRTVSSSTGYWDRERSEWVGTGRDESWQHSNRRQFGDSMEQALDELQRQFSVRIASLLEAFGVDESISTAANVRLRRTSGRLASWFSGTIGDEEFKAGGEYGKDAKIQEAFEQFVNDVMSKGIAAAVEASPLAQNIKDIFAEGLSVEQTDFALDALIQAATALSNLDRAPEVFQRVEQLLNDVVGAESFEELSEKAVELSQMNAALTTFYDVFTSAEDKFQDARMQLLYAFDDIGVAMPSTIDEFHRMVDALDLSTEEGRELFLQLMDLAPAFLTVANAVEQAMAMISATTESTIEKFMMDVMSDQEKYEYYDERILETLDKLAESSDPATVTAYYEAAMKDLNAAWDLLSADEKARLRDEFIERAQIIDEMAQAQLSILPELADFNQGAAEAISHLIDAMAQTNREIQQQTNENKGVLSQVAEALVRIPESINVNVTVQSSEVGL